MTTSVPASASGSNDRKPAEVDAKILTDLGNLAVRARFIADSVVTGMHRSRNKGTSVEFAEHKEYSPGDNVRQLDWRAFARFDRDYIKQFEDESNIRALFVMDTSGSMGYPADGQRVSKLSYSATCAAALAYVLARQGDAVGLATYADVLAMRAPVKARRGHLQEVLDHLEALKAGGPSQLASALHALTEGLPRKTMIIVFSDLLDGGLEAVNAFGRLRARKNDVILFHVLDPDEVDFPFEEQTAFVGMENDAELQVDAREIREAYLQEMERFCHDVEVACRAGRVDYRKVRTDMAPGRVLSEFLAERASMRSSVR
ncbi:MAG: DUF58 domain-containing protein [Deltaproteobacteria bacterium]|nr:DUF58 domain-containing protein [Deltaproteobacteria bacterium]